MRLIWLFDIDGTLLLTDGAAREAFAAAVSERFPGREPLGGVEFAGRIDQGILSDILQHHGASLTAGEEASFWEEVLTHMRRRLTPERGRLLPGVHELLDAVEQEPGWVCALLTGNMTGMARLKLRHFGIAERFAFGAFGEEAPDRNALARVAAERARARFGVPAERCIVVGDTEHDIACARAAGAMAVAVATGSRSLEQLARYEPDLLLEDLRDRDRLIEWARGVSASAAEA